MSKAIQSINDLTPDKRNANKGTVRGLAMLEDSISAYGAGRSILADKDGNVIAGNKTLQAAVDAGLDIEVVQTDGNKLVVVQRTDLDLYADPKARELATADNRVGEVDLAWSAEALFADMQDGVDLTKFFDQDELDTLLAGLNGDEPPGDPGAAISRAEEWQKKWDVERGQVWVIGRHRLMCGDSYDPEHLSRLMDGKQADMLHTDPPYGIEIVKPRNDSSTADSGGAKPFGRTGAPGNRAIPDRPNGATASTNRKGKNAVAKRNSVGSVRTPYAKGALTTANLYPTIKGDAKRIHIQHGEPSRNQIIQSNLYPVIEGDDRPFDPELFIKFAPIVVLWGANYFADKLPISSCWICWDKREDITRNDFADGELAWTNQDKPMRIFHHLWNGLHKGSQHGERRLHPTEKPVALFAEIGKMFCDGGLWVDLFAGSGAQIVAAEQARATCYAMEWEPLYVASILERLSLMGLSPVKAEA